MIVLCGPNAPGIVAEVFRPIAAHAEPGPDALSLGHLTDGRRTLDEAIVARREGAFEINIHGGPAVVAGVLRRLAECGAIVAPGDYVTTSPASSPPWPSCERQVLPVAHPRWNNPAVGREMLAALPLARGMLTVAALSGQWAGGISELAARDDPTAGQLHSAAEGLREMRRLLQPAEVVLAGAPNAGKSTLANALVGRQASAVHQTAGTTRDWVREIALIKGVPVWLTDTAGIWRADDPLGAEAVRRARHCIDRADLVVLLGDRRGPAVPDWLADKTLLCVAARCDLAPAGQAGQDAPTPTVTISARTGRGMDDLKVHILARLGLDSLDPAAAMAFTDRQAKLLGAAGDAMARADRRAARVALERLLSG